MSAANRGAGILPVNGSRTSQSAALFLLPLLLLLALNSPAHEAHDSLAEATLNRETHRLEVTLSVHATDLERVLSEAAQRAVSLDKEDAATLDALILAYLVTAFHIQDDQGAQLPIEWIGRENESVATHQTFLLHFEVIVPKTASTLTLHQRTFCELHDDQINLVEFRDGARKQTLGFSPQHGTRTIPL